MDYFEKYLKYNTLVARMTGYFSAKAIYDTSIPLQARKEMLEFLIKEWTAAENDSPLIQGWVKEWEKEIQNLSA